MFCKNRKMNEVLFSFQHYYACSPDMNIFAQDALKGDKFVHLPYVPSHLYHILFELFKNAMRAVVEHHDG